MTIASDPFSTKSYNPLPQPHNKHDDEQVHDEIKQHQFLVGWDMTNRYISHKTTPVGYRHDALAYLSGIAWCPSAVGAGILLVNLLSLFQSSSSLSSPKLIFDPNLVDSNGSTIQSIIDRFQLDLVELHYIPYRIHVIFIVPVKFAKHYLLHPDPAKLTQAQQDSLFKSVHNFTTTAFQQIQTPLPACQRSNQHRNITKWQSWTTSQTQLPCIFEFIKYQATAERIHLIQTANYLRDNNFQVPGNIDSKKK